MSETAKREVAHYDPVAKSLHWAILLLVVIQFLSAWLAPENVRGQGPSQLVSIHMSFGIVILAVMLLRYTWRLTHPTPENDHTSPRWQQLLALLAHYAFYGLLVLLPLLGWVWASSRGWAVQIFGLFTLPPLVAHGSSIGRFAGLLHSGFAVLLLMLVGFHVAATLYHQYILEDGVMASMMPKKKSA